MEGAVRTVVVVTDKGSCGGGGQKGGCGGEMQETEDVGKRRRRKTKEVGRMKWNYQINPIAHTKITVLSMVLYLCHKLCVHLSFLLILFSMEVVVSTF